MLNVAALNGRICKDVELRHTPNDIEVCNFTLAVDRSYTPAGKEKQCDFIDITCFRQTAVFCSRWFHKGQLVAVEGAIQTRSYEDKQGNKRKATEIVASQVHFAERKQDGINQALGAAQAAGVNVSQDMDDFVEIVEITGEDSDGFPF